jgi:hypothetical protein
MNSFQNLAYTYRLMTCRSLIVNTSKNHTSIMRLTFTFVFTFLFLAQLAAAEESHIGVFYYPGWKDNVISNVSAEPWAALKGYPEREPKLGYYDDGSVDVIEQQLSWMANAGISYLILDWYWHPQLGVLKSHTMEAYFKAPSRKRVKLSIMWANHTAIPRTPDEFEKMVRFWLYYFRTEEYLTIDGKPVVFIFSTTELEHRARAFGSNSATLLAIAQGIAKKDGFPGIFFVGGAGANSPIAVHHSKGVVTGYDAFSAYNYHGPARFAYADGHKQSHNFTELDQGYRDHWQWMLSDAKIPYFVPMSSGWDRRPWGGSADPLHDNSIATATEFKAHLAAGRKAIQDFPALTRGFGVICCWNEFGEGSFIEPTRKNGAVLLDTVKNVFSDQPLAAPEADSPKQGVLR